MSLNVLIGLAIPAALILLAILVGGFAFARMYKRSTREVSLVKTGTGGRKVIIDGGTLVIPVLHEITKINMKTTRLEVARTGESALITLDRMRVDVGVEFYVTVNATEEGIARAAQTLGARTFDERALREMIEGKLVDGLRAVAAKMNLDDLHENRSDFVQQVQTAVSEDLKKNGLELETVSLTALDQTPLEGMDENNVFNALGMQNQAQRIADSRKHRAEIEAEADVAVVRHQQEAEVQKYEIQQSQEEARVNQSVKMEEFRARETSEKARKKEEAEKAAEEARIDRTKAIELAEQDRQIAIAGKSEQESVARAKADLARAEAIKATESIETERQVAEGERKKRLTILAAEEEAERSATTIRVSAKAERDAADDRAASMRELASAEADQITIKAEANKTAQLAEAEGNRALIESENSISAEIIDFRLAKARLESLPGIIAEMVKPAEKIGGITIHKVDGLNGGGNGTTAAGGNTGGNGGGLVNEAFDEMRKMAFQLPAISAIGKQVGLNMDTGMAGLLDGQFDPEAMSKVVAEALPTVEGPSIDDAQAGNVAAE
jgi:uncharacterized membrane protein YqiK